MVLGTAASLTYTTAQLVSYKSCKVTFTTLYYSPIMYLAYYLRSGFHNLLLISSHGLYSGFRLQFLNAVSGLGSSTSRGLFVDSCYSHCQTGMQETWLRADSPVLGNTVRECFCSCMVLFKHFLKKTIHFVSLLIGFVCG